MARKKRSLPAFLNSRNRRIKGAPYFEPREPTRQSHKAAPAVRVPAISTGNMLRFLPAMFMALRGNRGK